MRENTNKVSDKGDIIYPELSYKVVGAAFDVYNELRWGHKEVVYQRAFAKALDERSIKHEREKFIPVEYHGNRVGRNFIDFLVDDKIAVELKVVPNFQYAHIDQVVAYLKSAKLKLSILIYFLKDGVRFKRILNSE